MKEYNILLVDDEEDILNVLKRIFINEGYKVYTADNCDEGLKVLERKKIDLIISDQDMPGMKGIEFLERTVENYPDVIRIILTGQAGVSAP